MGEEVQSTDASGAVGQLSKADNKVEDETREADAQEDPAALESKESKHTKPVEDKIEIEVVDKKEEDIPDKVDSDNQPPLAEVAQNETESYMRNDATEQEEKRTTLASNESPTEDNPATESAVDKSLGNADSDNLHTQADEKDYGEPLLTINGDRIRRHSDTTKKIFSQLAKSDDLSKQILKKDFMQYFRNQGVTNLTARRLYSKFNPENTGSMNFEEFKANVTANTYKEEEEVKQ